VRDESLLGEQTSLRETVHSFSNFEQHGTMVGVREQTEPVQDCLRNRGHLDLDILGAGERGIEVEVLDVQSHEVGIVGHDRLQEDLDCGHLGGIRCHIAIVVNTVSTNRASNTEVLDTVLDLDFDYAVVVCGVFTTLDRLVMRKNGTHGLCRLDQSDELCGVSGDPHVAICTLECRAPFQRITAII